MTKKEKENSKDTAKVIAKTVRIKCEDNMFEYIIGRVSRLKMDRWEREFHIQRIQRKQGMLMMKRAQIEDTMGKEGIDPQNILTRLEEIDATLEDIDERMDEPIEIERDGRIEEVSREAASQAALIELAVLEPKKNLLDWLDDDPHITAILSNEIQNILFRTGESTKTFFDELMIQLSQYKPEDMIKVQELTSMIKEAFEATADPTKKKSEHVYDVGIESV